MRLAGVAPVVQSEPFVPPTQRREAVFPGGRDRQVEAQCGPHVGKDVAVKVTALVFHAPLTDDALVDRRSLTIVIEVKGAVPWRPAQAHGEMHETRGWTRELIERRGNTKRFCIAVYDPPTHDNPLSRP